MGIIVFIIFGFIVGLIARAIMPGRQSMGLLTTTLVGVAGSFIGGLIGNVIGGRSVFDLTTAGFIGSIVGALLLMLALGAMSPRGRLTT